MTILESLPEWVGGAAMTDSRSIFSTAFRDLKMVCTRREVQIAGGA